MEWSPTGGVGTLITLLNVRSGGSQCLLRLGEEHLVVTGGVRAQFRIRRRGRVSVQRHLAVAVTLRPHLQQQLVMNHSPRDHFYST